MIVQRKVVQRAYYRRSISTREPRGLLGESSALLANRDARTKVNSCRIYMLKVRGQIGPVMSRIELDHMLGESQRRHP